MKKMIFLISLMTLSLSAFAALHTKYLGKYALEEGSSKCQDKLVIFIYDWNVGEVNGPAEHDFVVRSFNDSDPTDFDHIYTDKRDDVESMLKSLNMISVDSTYKPDDLPWKIHERLEISMGADKILSLKEKRIEGLFTTLNRSCFYKKISK